MNLTKWIEYSDGLLKVKVEEEVWMNTVIA
ncbi:hypothetical protein JOC86_004554 [Bacillus pakistanensis]|uniref:Uncharacterized protein n=1 Tax=Rossellomorea pakistanensis TaxID=992288 RepID=A0ABS2NJE7_9BACI|nr:hypothetical protein [Bacillus pakistanensis]